MKRFCKRLRHRLAIAYTMARFWLFQRQWTKGSRRVKAIMDRRDNKFARLQAERDALQIVVDKLPKTADGVPVLPGMKLWRLDFDKLRMMEVISLDDLSSSWPATIRMESAGRPVGCASIYRWHIQACYSTREAASSEESATAE